MKIDRVRDLIILMSEHDVAEIEIEEEGARIRIKRGEIAPAVTQTFAAGTVPVALPQAMTPSASSPEQSAASIEPKEEDTFLEITAPVVGTFYRASAPDADPYIDVGDIVEEDTVVCIIEAMKVMNEIKAEVRGEVVEVLVENGRPVEFGEPLFKVRPVK